MDNERQKLQHEREMEQLKNEQLKLQLELEKTKAENSRYTFVVCILLQWNPLIGNLWGPYVPYNRSFLLTYCELFDWYKMGN